MNTREGREKTRVRGCWKKEEDEGDGEEEKQEVGKRPVEESRTTAGSFTARANYKTQLKWYHENALSNIVSTASGV